MPRSIDDRLNSLRAIKPLPPKKKPKPRRKRRLRKGQFAIEPDRLDECSDTELVIIAERMGFENVSRQMLREDIISAILGDGVEDPAEDPVYEIRERIHTYVEDNRSMINVASMRCDLDCPNCPRLKVMGCFVDNQDQV
jgi:hypothetical protein